VISPKQRPVHDDIQHCEETVILRAGFEPAIPATERPRTNALVPRGGWDRHVFLLRTLNVRPTVHNAELSVATVNIKLNNGLSVIKPKIMFPSDPLCSVKQTCQCYTQLCGL
jgi:hypothetical protein